MAFPQLMSILYANRHCGGYHKRGALPAAPSSLQGGKVYPIVLWKDFSPIQKNDSENAPRPKSIPQ